MVAYVHAQCTTPLVSGVSNVSCFGGFDGAATVAGAGGIAPYTYSWDTSPVKTTAIVTDLYAGTYIVTVTDASNCVKTATVTITQPAAILDVEIISQTNVLCNGDSTGTVTVIGKDGAGSYTYSWDNGPFQTTATATGLAFGNHTVKVKDANYCTAQKIVSITQPAELQAKATQNSQVTCKGSNTGVATVTVTGGTEPYSYVWDNSNSVSATATDLVAGDHSIIITDSNGCTTTVKVTIFEPNELVVTEIPSQNFPVKCKGESNGSATVEASGGTPSYSYSWDNNPPSSATATDLAAGTHTVKVIDENDCEAIIFVTIKEPSYKLTAIAIPNSSVKCFGGSDGSATVTAFGGTPPYTYDWGLSSASKLDTATDLAAGVHTVKVIDNNGCETITAPIIINEPTILTATADEFKPVTCNGVTDGIATVVASGGTISYTYSWDNGPFGSSAVATNLAAGNHTVTVRDANGCEVDKTVFIDQPDELTVTVIKNIPVKCNGESNGEATVRVEGGTGSYTYVWQNSSSTSATATDLPAGTHIITVTDANDCSVPTSVIITEPDELEINAIEDSPVKCNGEFNGVATVTAIGGTTPYTYYWDNNVASSATSTDLAAGTHTIKVIDGKGCEKTTTVLITEPTVLTATATENSPVKCKGAFNGEATVTTVGGTAPYTYDWGLSSTSTDATAKDLGAGSHTITIYDANGCSTTASVTITELNVLNPSVVQLNAVSCNGGSDGSARVTVTGGKLPYTFFWDGNSASNATATDLAAGTHIVKIIDGNACEITVSVLITEPPILSATAAPVSPVKCQGESNGSATVTPIGGVAPYTYSWDKSTATTATATNLVAGLHNITIKDKNGCTTSAEVTITEPNALALTANIVPIICDKGGSITVQVTGGVSTNYFYAWTGPSAFSQSGANLRSITNLLNGGTYKLTVTDDNGCALVKNFTLAAYEPLQYTGPTAIEFDTCNSNPTFGINVVDIRGGIPYTDGNGNPYYYFEWYGPNDYHSNEAVIPIIPGNYVGIIIDSQNCRSAAINFTVTTPYTSIVVAETIGNVGCDSTNNDGYIAVAINGGKIPYNIVWEREIPGTATGNPNPTYSIIGQNILRVNNLMEGRYRLTVTSNLFSCSDSNPAYKFQAIYTVRTQNSIRILEAPVLDSSLCGGNKGTLTVKVIDDNDGPVSFYYNGALANADDLGGNNYLVYIDNYVPDGLLNIVNEFGCGEAVIIDVGVAEPSFDISSVGYNLNGVININETVTFRNTSTQPYTRLEWDFGDNSDLSEEESPVHTYVVSGIRDVTLRIYNDLGCYKEYTEKISVGKGYLAMFPDIFTPNNDGINDYFQGELIGFDSFEFEIYDLWNNLLFATATDVIRNNTWGWDGNLSDGTAFNGKVFKYVFKGIDNFGKEVIVSNQAILLR